MFVNPQLQACLAKERTESLWSEAQQHRRAKIAPQAQTPKFSLLAWFSGRSLRPRRA